MKTSEELRDLEKALRRSHKAVAELARLVRRGGEAAQQVDADEGLAQSLRELRETTQAQEKHLADLAKVLRWGGG